MLHSSHATDVLKQSLGNNFHYVLRHPLTASKCGELADMTGFLVLYAIFYHVEVSCL